MYNKNIKRTTREVACLVGISRVTLQRWITAGRIVAPKPTLIGARGVRLWSASEIAALMEVKKRIYRKGRGRRKRG
jgi:excisionase family DNA binding protein